MPSPFVLLLALASLQVQNAPVQNEPPKDALALLTEVSHRYAEAKSYHIEAVQERIYSNALQHSWQKTLFTAIVMPGGRYRYEGRSGYDAAVVVSDGTTQWDYHSKRAPLHATGRTGRISAGWIDSAAGEDSGGGGVRGEANGWYRQTPQVRRFPAR